MNRTMTEEKLDELLNYSETSLCDYKSENYKINEEEGRVSLLKDVLSMANTIREKPAYILIGVLESNGVREIIGIDNDFDENQVITFLKGSIGPEYPEFAYYTFIYKKHKLGIYEIGISFKGPFYSKKSFGQKILEGKIYYRYGSTNTEASEKTIEEIKQWMSLTKDDKYTLISEKALEFNTKNFNYVLFIGDDYPYTPDQYSILSRVDWSMIIDLTKNSENDGFYKHYRERFEKRRSVHLITPKSSINHIFYENKSMIWFMAGGEHDEKSVPISQKKWSSRYLTQLRKVLTSVISYSTKNFVYLDLYSNDTRNTIENLIAEIDCDQFERYVRFKWSRDFSYTTEAGYVSINTIATHVFKAIKNDVNERAINIGSKFQLPSKNGPIEITDVAWIQEEIEPVYLNCDLVEKKDADIEYFRGGMLHWYQMNPHIAVTRYKLKELRDSIRSYLGANTSVIKTVYLDYQSGAGATTVLRMLAWELHEEYPTLIIENVTINTAMRIKAVYDSVEKTRLFLLIDNPAIDTQMIDNMKTRLQTEGIQAVIIQSRRHINDQTREDYLTEKLNNSEANGFYSVYSKQLQSVDIGEREKKKRQKALFNLGSESEKNTTPFMYALTTFEGSYIKIDDYVEGHLYNATEEQKNIFLMISTIQYFTGMSVPELLLKHTYENITGRVSVKNRLNDQQIMLITTNDGNLRLIHQSVAKETLIYLCGIGLINKEAWKNNLEDAFEYIIDILEHHRDNYAAQQILTKLFLQQLSTNADSDSHFSVAIDSLNTDSAKKRIFNKLLDVFPENAYIYSNLARFYYHIEWNPDKALEMINQACAIEENYTFYHIKGLIYAKRLRSFINDGTNDEYIKDSYIDFVNYLKEQKGLVLSAYDKCIELNFNNEYPYVAKMVFFLSIIRDYRRVFAPDKKISELIKLEKYFWCTEFIEDISDLIVEMKTLMDYTDLVFEVDDYESQLNSIIGNMSTAINNWNNLLSKKDVYRPSIRQNIVNGYYSLAGNNWNSETITVKRRDTIINLLEENIKEERDNCKRILQWFDVARNFNGYLEKAVRYFEATPYNSNLQFYFHGMTVLFAYGLKNHDKSSITLGVKYSNHCEIMARMIPYRNRIREAYDPNKEDILSIVRRNKEIDKFLPNIGKIVGRIECIDKTESGRIIIPEYNLTIKFNPSRNKSYVFRRDKDENRLVKFVLGFTYEGPYAYEVELQE